MAHSIRKYGIYLFEELVWHLWEHRKDIIASDFEFNYPDYAGLPKRISNRLSGDVVDTIQETLKTYGMSIMRRKRSLGRALRIALFPMSL